MTKLCAALLFIAACGSKQQPTSTTTTKTETQTVTDTGDKQKSTTTETKVDQPNGSQTTKSTVQTEHTTPGAK